MLPAFTPTLTQKIAMPSYTLDSIKDRVKSLRLDDEFPARGSGYRGYTAKMLTFWRLSATHQAAYLKSNSAMPHALSGDFGQHAEDLLAAHQMLKDEWRKSFTAGIMETFGRAPEVGDYKVSGIGREEFSLTRKVELRELARLETKVGTLALACKRATGFLPTTAFVRAGCPRLDDQLRRAERVPTGPANHPRPLRALIMNPTANKAASISQLVAETDAEDAQAESQAVDRPRG